MGSVVDFGRYRGTFSRVMGNTTSPARVISVTSGKGGVGKTNVSVNVGLALTQQGKRVLLLDADLGLANINILLGFEPKANIQQVVKGLASFEDIIVSHPSGLDIIPAGSGLPELTNLSEEERTLLQSAMNSLAAEYDYVLVDTAAGIGDNVLYFNVAAEDIIVVVDPEPTSITDSYAIIKVLSTRHSVNSFHILANRVPKGSDGRATYGLLSAATNKFLNVSLKFLGSISEDESVSAAVIQQKPCLELFPSSRASLDFHKIAKKILSFEGTRKAGGGLQFFFKELVENC